MGLLGNDQEFENGKLWGEILPVWAALTLSSYLLNMNIRIQYLESQSCIFLSELSSPRLSQNFHWHIFLTFSSDACWSSPKMQFNLHTIGLSHVVMNFDQQVHVLLSVFGRKYQFSICAANLSKIFHSRTQLLSTWKLKGLRPSRFLLYHHYSLWAKFVKFNFLQHSVFSAFHNLSHCMEHVVHKRKTELSNLLKLHSLLDFI